MVSSGIDISFSPGLIFSCSPGSTLSSSFWWPPRVHPGLVWTAPLQAFSVFVVALPPPPLPPPPASEWPSVVERSSDREAALGLKGTFQPGQMHCCLAARHGSAPCIRRTLPEPAKRNPATYLGKAAVPLRMAAKQHVPLCPPDRSLGHKSPIALSAQ